MVSLRALWFAVPRGARRCRGPALFALRQGPFAGDAVGERGGFGEAP